MSEGKILFIASGIGAGILWALKYIAGKKEVGEKLDTETKVSIEPIKGLYLKLKFDVIVKNPTENTLTIRQPYVTVFYNGKQIGQSQLSNTEIEIPAYLPKSLEPIFLTIPATGLLTLGDALYKTLLLKREAIIKTLTTTSVKLGGVFSSQTIENTTTLNKK